MLPFESITVTGIESIVTVSSKQDEIFIMKKRPSYGLSFCLEGQITYLQDGVRYVSDPSCAILLPEGQRYSLHRDKRGRFPLVNFHTAEPITDRITLIPVRDAAWYISELAAMQSLMILPKNRAKVMSLFYNLLHRLAAGEGDGSGIGDRVAGYIEDNYTDPDLTNTAIAAHHGISEVYLRKLFLEKYGKTPHKYIIDLRMARARQLLADAALTVTEISEQCGFSNPYHFSRSFKSRVGITPVEYAARNRTKNM